MPFVSPALASPWPNGFEPDAGDFYAEEKFDGHRLIVEVGLPERGLGLCVRAWSRDGRSRILPPHLRKPLEDSRFPYGVYDGELIVPGTRSYGVVELSNFEAQVLVLFDVLRIVDTDLTAAEGGRCVSYTDRRALLSEVAASLFPDVEGPLRLAPATCIDSGDQLFDLARSVWSRDGEGLIVKATHSVYRPGKRMRDWLKIKQLRSAVLTLIGFKHGKMGAYAVALLRDDEGFETAVKWKDLEWLRAARDSWVGRRVRIEFQERTPDGSYRHPRWDRFEEECV
jgi:ATP-dependent DNA ligase